MTDPSIFIGSLPGEDEIKLLVDGVTVAEILPGDNSKWSNADRLLLALTQGKGGWNADTDDGKGWFLTPRDNPEPWLRTTMRTET